MRVISFLLITLLCLTGCSYFVRGTQNDVNNDLKRDEINLSLEAIAKNICYSDSLLLVSDLNKLKFYTSNSFDQYQMRVNLIKEKHKDNSYCYDYICLLDSNVSRELVLNNKLEARHIIENSISILKKYNKGQDNVSLLQ